METSTISPRSSRRCSRFLRPSVMPSRRRRAAPPLRSGAGRTSPLCYFRAVGDAQRLSSDEQLRLAREQYEDARDFTVAVEEEFAILDPRTLEMVGRFEELFAAAQGTDLEGHLVGELISSEV